ncbi:MAG: hypothetical protein JW797_12210 [Bradymonadales bacterium]|nr:hypothetical protein [Bradymonadales bacterium]
MRRHLFRSRWLLLAAVAVLWLWSKEAMVSGSSSAELVRDLFRLSMDTPSIMFPTPEDDIRFHGEFRQRADTDLEWLANRIQAVLENRDQNAIELGRFQPDLPWVIAQRDPDEDGSLERAPLGPVRYLVNLQLRGEALSHVPAITAVSLDLTLQNRPSREALQALVASIEEALAASEPEPEPELEPDPASHSDPTRQPQPGPGPASETP